jgi:type I restriction enzyme M protein
MNLKTEINYHNPVDNIVSKIWVILNYLRRSRLNSSEEALGISLFLLSLYRENIISKSLDEFRITINSLMNKDFKNQKYEAVASALYPVIKKVNKNNFDSLFFTLSEIDQNQLLEKYPEIFDNILFRFSNSQGRSWEEYLNPEEISRLIFRIADVKDGAKVYNPFAGLASIGINLNNKCDYYGQEIKQFIWAIGAMRLIAYDRIDLTNYICEDSFFNWPTTPHKFDLIIANPSFAMLNNTYFTGETKFRSFEQFLIQNGIHSLNKNGKFIALLTQRFLYNASQRLLKKQLIDEDLLETIILMPGGLMHNASVPFIILVLNKMKKLPGKVKFIDAKNFVTENGNNEKILDDFSLNSFIHADNEDENNVRIVDSKLIRDNEYNLSFARYFTTPIDGERLGNIIQRIRTLRVNLPETGKIIRIRDLKNDPVNFRLDLSNIEKTDLNSANLGMLSDTSLLLSVAWYTLKPTLFEFKGEPIFIRQDIYPFKVDESKVDLNYLINELQAEYVQKQIESHNQGAVIPYIRLDDLMEIVIKLPPIKEQRAKMQGVYELTHKLTTLVEDRQAFEYVKSVKQFNEFASLKHTLGRPRQNILDWSDNLLDFLYKNQNGFEALNRSFSEFYDIDILSAIKEIKRDVNFITDVLEKGENGLILSEYEKQLIPLSDINNFINELSNNGYKFKIKKMLLKGKKLKLRGINANKTLFIILLDNILTNANKYAFDKQDTVNEVVIELTDISDSLLLEIRNNGNPFPMNYDRDKFITKYSTADISNGSGLGGYDIHRIASDFHNPDWILSLNEDPLFPVKFKFQFPIKLIS